MINMKNLVEKSAKENIDEAQRRQRYSYAKRHNTGYLFKDGDKVFAGIFFGMTAKVDDES